MASVVCRAFDELSAAEWHDIARLRVDVFVVEQGCAYPEFDGRDSEPATRHAWITGPGAGLPELAVAAYARALREPGGGTRIGRVVTDPSARRRGLGGLLVGHLVRTTGGPWILDAQARLVDWYSGFGFSAAGETFDDWGMPHVPMRREAPDDDAAAERPCNDTADADDHPIHLQQGRYPLLTTPRPLTPRPLTQRPPTTRRLTTPQSLMTRSRPTM